MTRNYAIATLVFAVLGLVFASVATYDFAQHLDRQVHGIHCTFLPGVTEATTETTGCQVTLMSRYSSVLRTTVWGGIPISLGGMAAFAFLAFYASYLLSSGAHRERTATGFGLLAWIVPVLTSVVMGYIALVELDAACKLCIGIYTSSFLGAIAAALLWNDARRTSALGAEATLVAPPGTTPGSAAPNTAAGQPAQFANRPAPAGRSVLWAIPLAAFFVLAPVGAYVAAMPSYAPFEHGCGQLPHPEDRYDVLLSIGGSSTGRAAIEVLDPLCPSCKGLESRLDASGLESRINRKALLFPLDDECNWMVTTALHPGACAVSEAMLCEPSQATAILEWAFANQQSIIAAERARDGAAANMVTNQFPGVRGCVGSTRIRSQLHRGLRWAVSNQLPVLTPQLFVEGQKVCNEDTDLGLEYTLSHMLDAQPASRGESR